MSWTYENGPIFGGGGIQRKALVPYFTILAGSDRNCLSANTLGSYRQCPWRAIADDIGPAGLRKNHKWPISCSN